MLLTCASIPELLSNTGTMLSIFRGNVPRLPKLSKIEMGNSVLFTVHLISKYNFISFFFSLATNKLPQWSGCNFF